MAPAAELDSLIARVRNEFLEMPGLRLNTTQAMRLWGLKRDECQRVIDALVAASFLQRTRRGEIVRIE
jgi:hypothetical protein